ncbi:hypothetical protein JY651_43590 [Pyxidicoccus parkwayensis]|uniref:Phasin domain-containing protein n=1 Tax=Pyxidicoccus parkwayensis TaxID=2813578 RepID=A0ABX7NTZ2_9BACT|nr:hypothetical protein [Pyxidicoccus parkwaysis]QSQ21958.1 hypothetical protein JY651_43590 [Pyxidicoccus parkwaysis]
MSNDANPETPSPKPPGNGLPTLRRVDGGPSSPGFPRPPLRADAPPAQRPALALAQEMVAHAAATAVADATNYLRSVGTLTTASMAACTKLMLQSKDPAYGDLMGQMNQTLSAAAQTFEDIGLRAATILSLFSPSAPPSNPPPPPDKA